jgi:hypothetical protein
VVRACYTYTHVYARATTLRSTHMIRVDYARMRVPTCASTPVAPKRRVIWIQNHRQYQRPLNLHVEVGRPPCSDSKWLKKKVYETDHAYDTLAKQLRKDGILAKSETLADRTREDLFVMSTRHNDESSYKV